PEVMRFRGVFFFFQAEDGIRDYKVTGVQTCALPIWIELNMKFVRRMLDEHLGTGPSGLIKRDHSQRLYMLLVLSIWAKWLGSLRSEERRVGKGCRSRWRT